MVSVSQLVKTIYITVISVDTKVRCFTKHRPTPHAGRRKFPSPCTAVTQSAPGGHGMVQSSSARHLQRTALVLQCIVNGMTQQFFSVLSLVTLTFELWHWHSNSSEEGPNTFGANPFSRSWNIWVTNNYVLTNATTVNNNLCMSSMANSSALSRTVPRHCRACGTTNFFPVTSQNIHGFYFFTRKLNSKFVVTWSLNNPPHITHVATLPCDLSLITMHVSGCRYSFPILVFHKLM